MRYNLISGIKNLLRQKSKRLKLVIFVIIITVCAHYSILVENNVVLSSPSNVQQHGMGLSIINSTKVVLMVKLPYWGFRLKLGRLGFINAGCEVGNCVLTTNHSYVKDYKFDAFLIHAPTRTKGPWTLSNRTREQIFIIFSTEPPAHMPLWTASEDYFNWTMSYLPESDIHLPYGRIEPLPGAPTTESERLYIQEQLRLSKVSPVMGKTKLAVWTVSNCNPGSNRMQYVKELQKYIEIDVFSENGCGKKEFCRKQDNDECIDKIEQTYKFYIAFENSICREYVTEKFFNSIGRNIVPIVLGGANYSEIAPHHSYINALDYSPRQLGEYLQKLDQDDSLYAQYFWWKPYYRVLNLIQTNDEAFCKLCAALHANPIKEKVAIPDRLNKWYFEDSRCINRPNFKPFENEVLKNITTPTMNITRTTFKKRT